MITVARIYYIYTNIWISVNGFILYVVGAGVKGFRGSWYRVSGIRKLECGMRKIRKGAGGTPQIFK
jgi:hypothetical protein